MNSRFHARRGLIVIAMTGALPSLVSAQTDWPKKQAIKLTVPFTPGSATDIVGRILAEKLGPILGTSVIVENRPGAGGTLGAALVAKAAPDGYTLLVHSAGHLVNPAIYKNLTYDTLKDFSGVTPLASLPNVLVAAPMRFKDVKDLVETAKAQPGALNYASAGNGSATHMNAEVFRHAAGIRAQHVPFKGTPEAITETIAGRVDWFFAPMVSVLPLLKEKRLTALAVGTAKRSEALPQVPTTVEAGVPNSAYLFWLGLFAPSKMSRTDVSRLQAEVAKIMSSPEVKDRLDRLGAEAMISTPEAFDSFLSAETDKALRIVNAAGIKVD